MIPGRDLRVPTGNFMVTEILRVRSGTPGTWLGALWERALRISRRTPKGLRLCESLPLGERRFVAVVEFEKARFLVGGTASSLVLLSRLADSGEQAEGLKNCNDNQGGGKC